MYFISKKNIAMEIIFTILTCGLYGIYWLACIANDINALEENRNGTTGGMVILLTILTCGLYQIYYIYMASKRVYYLYEDYGVRVSDNSIVNLLLCLATYFVPGAYIIAYAIIQNDMNKLIDLKENGKAY